MREVKAEVFIPLSQGKVTVIDFVDFEKIRNYRWHAVRRGRIYYACRTAGGGDKIYLHRVIAGASAHQQVDHRDGDGLNNVRSNLRLCSPAQNLRAFKNKRDDATSQFRGVYRLDCRHKKPWGACIRHRGRTIHLGQFVNEIDAARAYDKKAVVLFGEFAYPNFLDL